MARRVLLALAAAALLAACASVPESGPAGPAEPVDAETVYRARCSICHVPWSPTDFSPSEWPRYVRKYAPRAGLTPGEREAVLAYLVRESGRR